MVLQQSLIRNAELSTSRNLQNCQWAWQHIQGEVSWNTREIRVKYYVYPWNTMFTSEVGRSWNDDATLPNSFCLRTELLWKSKTRALMCSAVFAFRRIATITSGWNIVFVGQTSHFCKYQVKLRHSTNTKLNFDVGNAGYIYILYISLRLTYKIKRKCLTLLNSFLFAGASEGLFCMANFCWSAACVKRWVSTLESFAQVWWNDVFIKLTLEDQKTYEISWNTSCCKRR